MTHQQAIDKHAAERYLLEEMPELERFAFEEHFFDCEICADDVRTGAVIQEGVKGGLLPEGTAGKAEPTRLMADIRVEDARPKAEHVTVAAAPGTVVMFRPSVASRVMPWAVAATLAMAAGYQALVVVPGLQSQVVGPSVLSPVTLRGASRGATPTLTRPTNGALSFAVDLSGIPAGARLAYDLRAADGKSVATGTAAAPPPGTPLLLLIPASALEAAGTYVVSVTAGEGSAAVDYAFTITNP
jgi:hypothetical protein